MKNKNEWFKFEHRVWLEDERVLRMPMAAQGLYVRALCYQARHGSLPVNQDELAIVLMAPGQSESTWQSVLSHFNVETIDGEDRWYNKKLREILVVREAVCKSKAANRKNKCKTDENHSLIERKSKPSPRASNSISISKSVLEDSFTSFWTAYPRKESKEAARKAWVKAAPSDDLALEIVAHVSKRVTDDPQWTKDGGSFIPHASTFINGKKWEDKYVTGSSRPTKLQEYHNRVVQHDPGAVTLLTDEEKESVMEGLGF